MLQYIRSASDNTLTVVDTSDVNTWIRSEKPNEAERAQLIKLGLDEDIVTDALDPHEVPRLEIESPWTYFITRVPDIGDDFNDFTTPILFAFSGNQFVTISRDSLGRLWQPFIERTHVSTARQKQLYLLMVDAIAQSYQNRVAQINRQVRALTNNITSLKPKEIATIVEYERKLNDYLDALIPTNASLEKLLANRVLRFRDDDLEEIEDLSVDLEQVIARCKALLRTIQNVRDSYRAVMDTRLNETMRLLTIVTVVLTVPTMLAGILGMNVNFPFDMQSNAAFWFVVCASIIGGLMIVFYFTRKR